MPTRPWRQTPDTEPLESISEQKVCPCLRPLHPHLHQPHLPELVCRAGAMPRNLPKGWARTELPLDWGPVPTNHQSPPRNLTQLTIRIPVDSVNGPPASAKAAE